MDDDADGQGAFRCLYGDQYVPVFYRPQHLEGVKSAAAGSAYTRFTLD